MYSTCLFCHRSLGNNSVVEWFPVGKRLAFDTAKGRLWVVCPHCARWNLTPIEERWEAIEVCERRFQAEPLRAQTNNIGYSVCRDGLELVRIGRPLRPEFAAWRYGDRFGARRRLRIGLLTGGVIATAAGLATGFATGAAHAALVVLAAFPPLLIGAVAALRGVARTYKNHLRVLRVPRHGGRPYLVYGVHLRETDLAPGPIPGSWILNFRHSIGEEVLAGDQARRVLGILLTRINASGASVRTTRAASTLISKAGGPEAYLAALAVNSRVRAGNYRERRAQFRRNGSGGEHEPFVKGRQPPVNRGALPLLSETERLALEMAVHEEEERLALEHDIRPLLAAWREAEEVAGIADGLLTPSVAPTSAGRA
jgi:hypothetical protein